MSQVQSLRYTDFNNNVYSVSHDTLSYNAIQPVESSSGTFSGGEDKTTELNEAQFKMLVAAASAIAQAKTLHRDKRKMLTVILSLRYTDDCSKSYIIPRSDLQRKLEGLLKVALAT